MSYKEPIIESIPQEKFEFVQLEGRIKDKELETKPIGFFQDAMIRFRKNRGSVVCGIILLILVLYGILAPIFSKYQISEKDGHYQYCLPKLTDKFDLGFWNGCEKKTVNQQTYDMYLATGSIRKFYGTDTKVIANREQIVYNVLLDSYANVGYCEQLLTQSEFDAVVKYQEETGIQLLYPMIDYSQVQCTAYEQNANAWFKTDPKGIAERNRSAEGDEINQFQDIYLRDGNGDLVYYTMKQGGAQYQIRTLYNDWYYYKKHKTPVFIFGADEFGYDIFTRLAAGARLSFLVSMSAAVVQLIIGIVIGSLEGYYGGLFDLIFERVKEIFAEIPSVVFIVLFQLYFARTSGSLFVFWITLIIFGWMGISGTTRAQFYRFKGMEYVMAARTLGAKDRRLIFRHILPNASGFIITSCVLVIPGIIFSETTYSYLGIINLNSAGLTSIGAILSNGQATMTTFPHCVFFPAAFIAILLICFNIFGNGLRDAFNPVLRGTN